MMNLSVITHTNYSRTRQLAECISSVRKEMLADMTHYVIECGSDSAFRDARINAIQEHEYVVFVDDDDTLIEGMLMVAWKAMKQYKPGIVFTREVEIDYLTGNNRYPIQDTTYRGISTHPRVAHHLCIINCKYVDCLLAAELDTKYGAGVDWFIKASAALRHSALHIPAVGYNWTTYNTPNSLTGRLDFTQISSMSADIKRNWPTRNRMRVPTVYMQ